MRILRTVLQTQLSKWKKINFTIRTSHDIQLFHAYFNVGTLLANTSYHPYLCFPFKDIGI